ncbi:MAG: hypothetical protein KA371_06745 [Acidobacteria bacterium]|nr:hypothetical protein [Acidobacteriota bacterium]
MRSQWSFRRAALAALVFVLVAPIPTWAQTRPRLFGQSARDPRPATSDGRTARARLVLVRVDLLGAALDRATSAEAPFTLNLFDDVLFDLRRVRIDTSTPGYRSWIGTSGAGDDVIAALTLGPAGLSGGITAHGTSYALEAVEPGETLVRELSPLGAPPELPAQIPPRATTPAAAGVAAAEAPARIDVLVLYTEGARIRAGGSAQIEASLANAVAVTNTALERSAVDATLATVGLQQVPYEEAGGGLIGDLTAMSSGGALSTLVDSLRAATGADLVALVVGRISPSAGCGVAYLGPAPSAVFSVTEEACLFAGQWSFSHEIGHNFGADHAPGDPVVSPVPYARGYRDQSLRTLMAYAAPGAPARLLNYSSSTVREPAVTGLVTGNSLQDNARRLAETATTLAAYSTATIAPDAPLDLVASAQHGTVTVTWSGPGTGGPVTGYLLEAGPAPGSVLYGPFMLPTPAAVFPAVLPGRYYGRVRSLGPGGMSPPTADVAIDVAPACAVPGPAVVNASVMAGSATLQWFAPPGTGVTFYEVGLGSSPGALDLGVFGVGTLTAADVPAPRGQYFVRVRGTNACGPGGPSAELRVVVP